MQNQYMYLARKIKKRTLFSVGYERVTLLGQSLLLGMIITLSLLSGMTVSDAIGEERPSATGEKALSTIEFKREYLKHIIDQQERLVYSLVESPLMAAYLSSNIDQNRESLEQLFLTVSDLNDHYMQVRFIDALGQEQIRIDQSKNGTDPIIIKKDNLQNKSGRDYFKQTKKVVNGRLWHSSFDLNQEQGVIEKIINPTFRVASPVYFDGQFFGIVIINLEMSWVINHLIDSPDFSIYFVDAGNEFLVHPNPNKSWSKYLLGRAKYQEKLDNQANIYTSSLEDIFKNGEGIRMILEPVVGTEQLTE